MPMAGYCVQQRALGQNLALPEEPVTIRLIVMSDE